MLDYRFTISACYAFSELGTVKLRTVEALKWALLTGFDVLVNDFTEMEVS